MSIFQKAKKARENKKGFTLVELIVVIVILAILAAILVPALLGWIDKAKEKQIVLNASSLYKSAQAAASEKYAAQDVSEKPTVWSFSKSEISSILETADLKDKCTEAKIFVEIDTNGSGTDTWHKAYTIIGMKYVENNVTVYYENGGWITVTDSSDSIPDYAVSIPTPANAKGIEIVSSRGGGSSNS